MLIQKLLTLLIAMVFSLVASARVLVDTGPLYPSLENPTSNFSPAVGDQFQAADQFTLTSRALIRRIDFFGLYGGTNGMSSPPIQDDFTIRIFADANGTPTDLPIAEYRVGQIKRKLALHSGPLDYFGYRATFHQRLILPAGKYWLSIVNRIPLRESEVGLRWGLGPIHPSTGNLHFRENDEVPWFQSVPGYGIAFKLRGSKVGTERHCR